MELKYVGKGKLIAFTNSNHYEPDVVARYWFGGDENKVRSNQKERFKSLAFAVVLHHGTTRYASGMHDSVEAIPLMESLGQREVLLYADSNDHLWFCACKNAPQAAELSEIAIRSIESIVSPASPLEYLESKGTIHSILFTDIESATKITNSIGQDEARARFRDIEQVLATVTAANEGVVIKGLGDGMLASFPAASAAIDSAIAMQREITKLFCNSPVQVRIRIGINAGEPIIENKDVHGASVNLAARVMGQADGGQILVSETVRNLVRGKRYEFVEHSLAYLKGFDDSIQLFEVLWTEEKLLILGLAGKAGSGFDSEVANILEKYGAFAVIRTDTIVDEIWELPEVKRAVGEKFGKETIFDNSSQDDPGKWERKRGVLGKTIASDPALAEQLNAILNPYASAHTLAEIRRLVQSGHRRIAVASTRLVNKEQKLFCHRTWYIDRSEDQRHRAIEQGYSARQLPNGYVSAKIDQIMRLQGDVIQPHEFPYDDVIQHPENEQALRETILRRLRQILLSEQENLNGVKEFSVGTRHGQFVRSMASLAQITDQPIRLTGKTLFNPKSGNLADSIRVCIDACVQWSEGTMQTDKQNSAVEFRPGRSVPSKTLTFDLTNELSISLLVVTLIPLCLQHKRLFEFVLRGCTDLDHSSPCDYYKNVLFPLLGKLGIRVSIDVEKRGFWKGEMGSVLLSVQGTDRLQRLHLTKKGELQGITFSHNSSGLNEMFYKTFMDRMTQFCEEIGFTGNLRFESDRAIGDGQKSVSMSVALKTSHSIIGADVVCDKECDPAAHDEAMSKLLAKTREILDSPAALDRFTADKIILYLGLAGGAVTVPVSDDMEHIYTQLALLAWFHKGKMEVRLSGEVLHIEMDPMF